jgi:hypothetical protein
MCYPKIIRWVRQWGGGDRVVWVIVRKLDAGWKKAPGFDNDYIPLGTCANHSFGKWVKEGAHRERARMPHIAFVGFVSFTDGRHRFAWCRDHGIKATPVSVASEREAEIVKRLFGSTSRTCRLPRSSTA